jgi:phage-related protein
MDGINHGIDLVQFLIDNLGAIAALLLIITLVPVVMVFILSSILKKNLEAQEDMRKEYGQQINKIGSSMSELIGVLNGFISVFSGNIANVLNNMRKENSEKEVGKK